MVLVPEDAGNVTGLGVTAAEQDDDLPLALVQGGEEVAEHDVVFYLGFRYLYGDGVGELDEPDLDL